MFYVSSVAYVSYRKRCYLEFSNMYTGIFNCYKYVCFPDVCFPDDDSKSRVNIHSVKFSGPSHTTVKLRNVFLS